jgi:hypothetical protein
LSETTTLHLGDVVVDRSRPSGLGRGVVVWAHGEGQASQFPGVPGIGEDGYAIRVAAGRVVITGNGDGQWTSVAPWETTAEERVRSVLAGWRPAGRGEEAFHETLEWALLLALLTPQEVVYVLPSDGNWPTDVGELAAAVADCLDYREKVRGGDGSDTVR